MAMSETGYARGGMIRRKKVRGIKKPKLFKPKQVQQPKPQQPQDQSQDQPDDTGAPDQQAPVGAGPRQAPSLVPQPQQQQPSEPDEDDEAAPTGYQQGGAVRPPPARPGAVAPVGRAGLTPGIPTTGYGAGMARGGMVRGWQDGGEVDDNGDERQAGPLNEVLDHTRRQFGLDDNGNGDIPNYMRGTNALPPDQYNARFAQRFAQDPSATHSDVHHQLFHDAHQSGDMNDAAAVLAAQRQRYDRTIMHAQGAVTHGDLDGAMHLANLAHDFVPDGKNVYFSPDSNGNVKYQVHNLGDNSVHEHAMTPEQFANYLIGPATSFDHVADNGVHKNLHIASNSDWRMPRRGYQGGGSVDDQYPTADPTQNVDFSPSPPDPEQERRKRIEQQREELTVTGGEGGPTRVPTGDERWNLGGIGETASEYMRSLRSGFGRAGRDETSDQAPDQTATRPDVSLTPDQLQAQQISRGFAGLDSGIPRATGYRATTQAPADEEQAPDTGYRPAAPTGKPALMQYATSTGARLGIPLLRDRAGNVVGAVTGSGPRSYDTPVQQQQVLPEFRPGGFSQNNWLSDQQLRAPLPGGAQRIPSSRYAPNGWGDIPAEDPSLGRIAVPPGQAPGLKNITMYKADGTEVPMRIPNSWNPANIRYERPYGTGPQGSGDPVYLTPPAQTARAAGAPPSAVPSANQPWQPTYAGAGRPPAPEDTSAAAQISRLYPGAGQAGERAAAMAQTLADQRKVQIEQARRKDTALTDAQALQQYGNAMSRWQRAQRDDQQYGTKTADQYRPDQWLVDRVNAIPGAKRTAIAGAKTAFAPNIPDAAVAYLKANPDLHDMFDAQFGEGAAERVLGRQQ